MRHLGFLRASVCLVAWATLEISGDGRIASGDDTPAAMPPADEATAKALARANQIDKQMEASFGKGKYAEAEPLAREALAIREKALGPEHPEVADSLSNLGLLLQNMGQFAAAKPLHERALAIREKALGAEHPDSGASLNNLAMVLKAMGKYEAARPLYERSLAIREKALGPEDLGTAQSVSNLAALLFAMGRPEDAKPLFERALRIREKAEGPNHPDTALSLSNLAAAFRTMGRLDAALPLLERALRIDEKSLGAEHPNTASVIGNLGTVLMDMGQLERARPLLERALAINERLLGPAHPATANALNSLASLLKSTGQFEAARPLSERSLAANEKALGPEHPNVATGLNNLAGIFEADGQYDEARSLLERALRIREKVLGPMHGETAMSLNNLALLLKSMGRAGEARPLLERALAIDEKFFGPEHPETAIVLANLALALVELEQFEPARPLVERALIINEKALGPEHPTTVENLNILASLLATMNQPEAARPLYRRALATTERIVRRGSIGARSAERLALARKFRWQVDAFLSVSERLGSNGYAELLRYKGMIGRLDALDRALARHSDPALHERVEGLVAIDRRLATLANSIPPAHDEARFKAWQAKYAALGAEREVGTRALARAYAPFRETLDGEEAGVAEVQKGLQAGQVLVDLFRSRGRYLAWVVPPTGEISRVDLGKAEEIETLAAEFATATDDAASTNWPATGRKLRDLVFRPIRARIPDTTRTIYLVLDSALAAVPFGALPGVESGRSLDDEYQLVFLSMAQDLVPRKDAPTLGTGALLLGAVDYDKADPAEKYEVEGTQVAALPSPRAQLDRAPRGGHFDPLPGTIDEVAGLKSRLGDDATLVLASKVTEGRLRSMVVGKRILHFATHGFVRDDLMTGLRRKVGEEKCWMSCGLDRHLAEGHDPMLLTGLAMAGANPRDGADGDDGILTAAEASYLNLDACSLVVLSACETARGTPESGEGVLGLVHGFQLAGARSVVGSLWRVDDDATRLLMGKFYEGYLRAERALSPSEALREAARWLRDSKPEGHDYSSPRYWAAFVCYERR